MQCGQSNPQNSQASDQQAQYREHGEGLFRPDAVNDDSANQQCQHRGDAVAGIQPAEPLRGKTQLVYEDSFQRINAVVDVVVPEARQSYEDENGPAI